MKKLLLGAALLAATPFCAQAQSLQPGGAYVGHEIEKNRNSGQIYKVTIKMDDGTTQSFAQENAPQVSAGDRVRITNGVLTKM